MSGAKTKSRRDRLFSAAVLRRSFEHAAPEQRAGFAFVYEGVLRDLEIGDDEVLEFLGAHGAEVDAAIGRRGAAQELPVELRDARFEDALLRGASAIGVPLDDAARTRLARFAARLLEWNRRVNLTAITDPAEVAEKHLVDSLTLLRALGGARTVLDIGSGAGIPGAVLACVRPDLEVTCVDSVAKKVAFVKTVAAELDLPVRARAARAGGHPDVEGLPRADAVVSRALADPARWIPLGARYVAPGGVLLAMMGRESEGELLEHAGDGVGFRLEGVERFVLPLSGAARAIGRWRADD